MRIAVIGAGISGLSSAYFLSNEHEVVLLEKQDRLGGHANSVEAYVQGEKILVDTGFMVFNPPKYPNFVKLLKKLDVKATDTKMSLGVEIPGEVEFNGSNLNGLFANRKSVLNPRHYNFLISIARFRKLAKAELKAKKHTEETLEQWLKTNNLNQDVFNWFIKPMLSAIWSMKRPAEVGKFPAYSTFRFLDNHNILNYGKLKWKTLKGGSIEYVKKLEQKLIDKKVEIRLNQDIDSVTRSKDYAIIKFSNDELEKFDYVVFATHADTVLKLLADASDDEKTALNKFEYTDNLTVLHCDDAQAPRNKRVLSAWNYKQSGQKAVFTYCMNILQGIPNRYPMFVTLNPEVVISSQKIYGKYQYSHPKYSFKSLEGQKMIEKLQATNRTLFTGAHLGYGFHEDGIKSAIDAVEALGVKIKWH